MKNYQPGYPQQGNMNTITRPPFQSGYGPSPSPGPGFGQGYAQPQAQNTYTVEARLDRLEREVVELNRRVNNIGRRVRRIEDYLNIRE